MPWPCTACAVAGGGFNPVWKRLEQQGLLAPLTSIVPSTTAAALTSLWTGRSAAEHGIAGYELWLKEYGIVTKHDHPSARELPDQ